MRTRFAVALSLIAGIALGAVAIDRLHAQAKAPVYVIVETDVSDVERYTKEFAPKAQALSKKSGARLLAVSMKIQPIDGKAPARVAVQQWSSLEQATGWYESSEYKELREIGDKYAKFRIYALEGVPQ